MLTWPHGHGDWRPWLESVEPVFVAIAREVSHRECVLISCWDEDHRKAVAGRLRAGGADMHRVHLAVCRSNDTWARDHGPLTVLERGAPLLWDFRFDGWGGKYDARLDNQIVAKLHGDGLFGATPRRESALELEGGAIDTDGLGTLLTTTSCLLDGKRNPGLEQGQLEAQLREAFGVDRILWLHHGHLAGDDTDGHIDTLARFCDADTLAYVSCDDPGDEHYDGLRAMAAELAALTTPDARPYRLVPLPLPAPVLAEDGMRLPATYANFLIINDAVLVPVYDDPADAVALERLAGCFPRHEIVPVPCLPLVRQYGSLHCVTMQLPAGVLPGCPEGV